MTSIPQPTLVLDAEIEKAIPDKKKERVDGVQYCDGWRDFAGMGVAVVTAYDYRLRRARVFVRDNLHQLATAVQEVDHVVTFNGTNFDIPLLNEHGVHIPEGKHYDLCLEVRRAAGAGRYDRGYNLEAILDKNGLPSKGAYSAEAPERWQRKQFGLVIESCLDDSNGLRLLLEDAMRGQILVGDPPTFVTLPPLPHVSTHD